MTNETVRVSAPVELVVRDTQTVDHQAHGTGPDLLRVSIHSGFRKTTTTLRQMSVLVAALVTEVNHLIGHLLTMSLLPQRPLSRETGLGLAQWTAPHRQRRTARERRQSAGGLSQLPTPATALRRRQLAGELSQLLTPATHQQDHFCRWLALERLIPDPAHFLVLQDQVKT